MSNSISGKLVGTTSWYTYSSSFPTDKKYEPTELPFYYNESTLEKPGKWKIMKYIDGCFFGISRKNFDIIGGFDEEIFPGYFAENVLCFKAYLNDIPIKDCNLEELYKHEDSKTISRQELVKKWSKSGRELFYSKYALPNYDKFLEYLG